MLPSAGVFEPQNLRTFELQWCYLRRGKVAPPTPYSEGPRLQQEKTPGNWNHWRSLVFVLGSSPQIWQPGRIGSDLRDPSTSCGGRGGKRVSGMVPIRGRGGRRRGQTGNSSDTANRTSSPAGVRARGRLP